MTLHLSAAAALAVALAAQAWADPAAAEPQTVEIKGIRNPELSRYRAMLAGMDAFESYHELAPTAPEVRFRLRSQPGAGTELNDLTLRIAGDNTSINVPIDANLTFTLPRDEAAADDNADLLLNKPKSGYRWQPDIRSPNVSTNMRRLGDLRLECEVLVGVAKEELGFVFKAMINSLLLTTRWCTHEKIRLSTSVSPRKLSTATLLHDGRRVELKLSDKGRAYYPPLADKSYPDDTLIELEFADDKEGPP